MKLSTKVTGALIALSATALLQAAPVAAASTGTVNYDQGATTVWTSPTTGQTAKSYVQNGQTLQLVQSQNVWGTTWYQTSSGGWIPETYLKLGTTTNQTTTAGNITVSYSGGAITKWTSPQATAVKGYLSNGETVGYVKKSAEADGNWYQLTDGSWVSEQHTTIVAGNKQTTATTTTAAQTTTPATTQAETAVQAPTQQAPATQTPTYSTNNTYPWGQCTYYVKSVAPWVGNYWGNGNQWGASAAAAGFRVDNQPAAGAVISFAGGQMIGSWQADPTYGHVAYVQSYDAATNSVTITQGGMGFDNPTGPNTQVLNNASQFTYIHG